MDPLTLIISELPDSGGYAVAQNGSITKAPDAASAMKVAGGILAERLGVKVREAFEPIEEKPADAPAPAAPGAEGAGAA